MPIVRFKYEMTSTISGQLNPAYQVRAATDATADATWRLSAATRIMMQIMHAAYWFGEAGQLITDVSYEEVGTPGFAPQAVDQTEYSAVRTAASLTTELPSWSSGAYPPAYGPGSGGSNGRGDSACMIFKTTTPGRSGRGRAFFPYLTPSAIDTATGLLSTTRCSNVESVYQQLLETTISGYANPECVVYSPTLNAASLITSAKMTKIPSRLQTRTK